MRSARQATSFDIGESKTPATAALLQQPILFFQILDRIELPTMDPAGEQYQEKLQRLYGAKHCRQYGELRFIRGSEHSHRLDTMSFEFLDRTGTMARFAST